MTFTSKELALYGAIEVAALVPIVWALVDILRRPTWQFSTARKVVWVLVLGIGWLVVGLVPLALVSSLVYLFVIRRRLPPVTAAGPSMATWDPYAPTAGGRPPTLPPAGWYPDPSGRPGERWWDGRGWSNHTR